jgi:hypothetical protein
VPLTGIVVAQDHTLHHVQLDCVHRWHSSMNWSGPQLRGE